jgi:hypothetical protein|tara:strand:+ start:2130 stop:2249 length:120 start_codon:yes stop_codon:yes gene_type:complete
MVRKLLKKIFKFKEAEDIQEELFPKPVYVIAEDIIIDES